MTRLRSITLAYEALQGDFVTVETNTLKIVSTNNNDDWMIDLPSLTLLKGNGYNFYGIGRVLLQSDDWWLNMN